MCFNFFDINNIFLCVCEITNHKQTKFQKNVIKSSFNVMVCITFCYWMSDSISTLKKKKIYIYIYIVHLRAWPTDSEMLINKQTWEVFFYSFIYLTAPVAICKIQPDQGLNPGPLHWEYSVLATGPPGKSQSLGSLKAIVSTLFSVITKGNLVQVKKLEKTDEVQKFLTVQNLSKAGDYCVNSHGFNRVYLWE